MAVGIGVSVGGAGVVGVSLGRGVSVGGAGVFVGSVVPVGSVVAVGDDVCVAVAVGTTIDVLVGIDVSVKRCAACSLPSCIVSTPLPSTVSNRMVTTLIPIASC